MWRSVPHTPARSTFTSTSPGPGLGTGTSRISTLGAVDAFTTARIVRETRTAGAIGFPTVVGVLGFIAAPLLDRSRTGSFSSPTSSPRKHGSQRLAGVRAGGARHRLGSSLRHDAPPIITPLGAQINDPVGALDHVQM